MNFTPDMYQPSNCRLMRIEIELVGLPGKLSEMTTADKEGTRALFPLGVDEVLSSLGDPMIEKNSFAAYFRGYLDLKRHVSFNIHGYGMFTGSAMAYVVSKEIDAFNARLADLRVSVCSLLEKKYGGSVKREQILRFNPRVRYGIFLIPKCMTTDKSFIRQLEITFEKGCPGGKKSVPWLLESFDGKLMKKWTIKMKTMLDELHVGYELDEAFKDL